MTYLFEIFILLPFIGFLINLFIPQRNEKWLSRTAFYTIGIHMTAFFVFAVIWLINGHEVVNVKDIVIFRSTGYEFFIDFMFDRNSAVYLAVGSVLTFMVTIYSRVYLHRENGFKRFFNTLLVFYLGYNLTVLAGNMETLFVGWELLGISSFLLIAFYRDRYLPVRNAMKVYSIYRLGDIGLILAMWMSHHLWHENITFVKLFNAELVSEHLVTHSWIGVSISLCILIAALAKSAQLPFSAWLPRAMEGPTPSTAIFYGSLSVHLGVFLLMRTWPFWEHQTSVRILIAVMGVATALVATGIARVQSSVKSQIAYASIAQIGIIFVEIAAGLEILALIHFAGNAFLRTYQLLVSPSVVSYLIREQFYKFEPHAPSVEDSFPRRLQYSLYILCLKEWNLDSFIYNIYWRPIKAIGRGLRFLNMQAVLLILVPLLAVGALFKLSGGTEAPWMYDWLPPIIALIGLLTVMRSFTERKNVYFGWTLITLNHFWIALAVSYNEQLDVSEILMYLGGIAASSLLGFVCLWKLKSLEEFVTLDRYQGHSWEHPRLALVFLLACLGLSGFPITTAFVGEDLIYTHIHEDQFLLVLFTSLSLIIDGLSVMRIFSRIYMGPHVKTYHEVAYKSS